MVALLKEQVDIFTWLHQDTPGWNTHVVGHELPWREDCPPEKRPTPRKDDKMRMCVDCQDVNRASSRDEFLVLHIDALFDSTTQFSVFTFMDGFLAKIKWNYRQMI